MDKDGCEITEAQLREFLVSGDDSTKSPLSSHVGSCASCEKKLQAMANGGLEIADRLQLLSMQSITNESIVALQESIMIPQKDRFEIQEEIAKGGMGVVVRARDKILRRDVALKIIKSGIVQDSETVSRFVQEARISAILQHPGVVPIHDLGLLESEQPFLAMKMIEGQTLSKMIAGKAAKSRLLEVFAQICQTMAFVHSKNVIHRDLKPANIMVGEFGEVQVTDWGLAKVLGSKEIPFAKSDIKKPHFELKKIAKTLKQDVTTDSDWQTQAGEIIGTVAYMPPEQALGQIERLDKRSDVFALGAILCEILTGRPPCGDLPIAKALEFAQSPDYSKLVRSLQESGHDRELVELAQSCLQLGIEQRPADARVVSDAMIAWRESTKDRLREVEINFAKSEIRALTEKKRRRLATAFALSMLALVATLSFGLLYFGQQQRAELRAEQQKLQKTLQREGQINRFLIEASNKRKAAVAAGSVDPTAWQEVLHEIELAQNLVNEDTAADLRELVQNLRAEVTQQLAVANREDAKARFESETMAKLEEASRVSANQRLKPLEEHAGRVGVLHFERAFQTFGIPVESPLPEAKQKFDAASPQVQQALIFSLHEWLSSYDRYNKGKGVYGEWLWSLFDNLDSDPDREKMRKAYLAKDTEQVDSLLNENRRVGEIEYLLAIRLYSEQEKYTERREILQRAVIAHPNSFWLNFYLAEDYTNFAPTMFDSAVSHYLVCSAVRPENVQAQVNIGGIMIKQNRYPQALKHFEQLIKRAPGFAPIHVNIGAMYMMGRQYEKALTHLNKAVELDPKLIQAYVNLGDVNTIMRKYEDAEAAFAKALELNPEHPDVYVSMANISINRRKYDEATETLDKLFAFDPKNKLGLSTLANIQMEQGELKEAETTMKLVVELSPQETGQYVNLSIIQRQLEKFDLALATLKEAERINPSDYRIQQSMGFHYRTLGETQKAQEFFKKARELQRRANLPEDAGK